MSENHCAYCKSCSTMTREHLWPVSLHERLVRANNQDGSHFWLSRLRAEITSEPKTRDVCERCNNTVLSELDRYICFLFDRYFVRILDRHERVVFEFDYHFLKRWLLKTCYNSARVNSSRDLFVFEPLLPYIMGKDIKVGRSVLLFLQLSYPGEIPEDMLTDEAPKYRPVFFRPTANRVGHLLFRTYGIGQKLLRSVHLRSFTFYLAFFQTGENHAVLQDFTNVFLLSTRATALLRPSLSCVELECDGLDAWLSFADSRGEFVFSDSST